MLFELTHLIDALPGLAWTALPDGRAEFFNRGWLDYTGVTAEQAADLGWIEAIHPDDRARVGDYWRSCVISGVAGDTEARMRRHDGAYRWLLFRANPVRDAAGNISRWLGTNIEIEDRRRGEEVLQSDERNLSLIINTIPAHIYVLNTEGYVLYVNHAVMDYTGLSMEDVQHEDYRDRVIHPEDFKRVRAPRAAGLRRGAPFSTEQRVLSNDGQYRWFLVRYKPLLEQGRIVRWYVAAFDIEDRKRAEDAQARQAGVRADVSAAFSQPTHLAETLRGCTEAIVRHLDAAFARIWMLNNDESMLELQASAGMYTRLDGSYSRIPVGDLKVGWIAREKKAHLTNDVVNDPRVHDRGWAQSNGMVAFAGYPLVVENRLIGVVALFARNRLPESTLDTLASVADMIAQGVERKRAEEALRSALDEVQRSESKLRQVIDTIPALAWCNLPDGSNEFLNKSWHEYTGLSPEESHGWGWQAAFHPEDLPPLMETWLNLLISGESGEIEARLRRHDGVYRWFLIRAQPLRDESGKIARWYGTSTDIDDRKRAEAQVEQAYLRLAEAQRLSKTGSFISDLLVDDHNWSEEAFRIFEFDPAVKVTMQMIRDIVHPEDLPSFDSVIARHMAGTDVDFVFRIVTSRGAVKHIRGMARVLEQIAGRPLFIGALHDVTESKVAEEALNKARSELAHVARVTALSALTASIAHEVNQPLSGIITNANTCLRMLAADQPNVEGARETARRTIRDANRASEVITHLRALFTKKEPAADMFDLTEATEEVILLCSSDLQRKGALLRPELANDLPVVAGDRIQLQQVILNLLTNAADAMLAVDDRPREIHIKTELDTEDLVRVTVCDSGVGFDPRDADKLFGAFFSTKPQGMGIGLSVSRSIIESHHGRIWAVKNEGPGATFAFAIPRSPVNLMKLART